MSIRCKECGKIIVSFTQDMCEHCNALAATKRKQTDDRLQILNRIRRDTDQARAREIQALEDFRRRNQDELDRIRRQTDDDATVVFATQMLLTPSYTTKENYAPVAPSPLYSREETPAPTYRCDDTPSRYDSPSYDTSSSCDTSSYSSSD